MRALFYIAVAGNMPVINFIFLAVYCWMEHEDMKTGKLG
jgi:hypothetical protein